MEHPRGFCKVLACSVTFYIAVGKVSARATRYVNPPENLYHTSDVTGLHIVTRERYRDWASESTRHVASHNLMSRYYTATGPCRRTEIPGRRSGVASSGTK